MNSRDRSSEISTKTARKIHESLLSFNRSLGSHLAVNTSLVTNEGDRYRIQYHPQINTIVYEVPEELYDEGKNTLDDFRANINNFENELRGAAYSWVRNHVINKDITSDNPEKEIFAPRNLERKRDPLVVDTLFYGLGYMEGLDEDESKEILEEDIDYTINYLKVLENHYKGFDDIIELVDDINDLVDITELDESGLRKEKDRRAGKTIENASKAYQENLGIYTACKFLDEDPTRNGRALLARKTAKEIFEESIVPKEESYKEKIHEKVPTGFDEEMPLSIEAFITKEPISFDFLEKVSRSIHEEVKSMNSG